MEDPVVLIDGHSYEKQAIANWLKNNNRSPMTNEVIKPKTMIPNHALRKSIDNYK